MNELIFLCHTLIIGAASLGALAFGKSALVALVCVECLLANLFVLKQIMLFGLHATCSDAYTIGATVGLNLLQEYFGPAIAKKTIYINFFLLVFYALVSQIHIWYAPSSIDTMQQHFIPLLEVTPRIVIASFAVFLFTQLLDFHLYGFLKRVCVNRFLLIRNYASIIICQGIDTILFSFLGLYGIIDNLWEVICISYSIKLLAILVATPFVAASKSIYERFTAK